MHGTSLWLRHGRTTQAQPHSVFSTSHECGMVLDHLELVAVFVDGFGTHIRQTTRPLNKNTTCIESPGVAEVRDRSKTSTIQGPTITRGI